VGSGQELRLRHAERLRHPGQHELPRHAGDAGERLLGRLLPAFKALFEKSAKPGLAFQPFTAEAFDSTFVAFLAALEAKSAQPAKISQHVVSVTTDPGTAYTFEQLDQAIQAVLDGKKIHFVGATGPLNFSANGRVNALAYDIWQHKPDGSAAVVKTVTFQP
jgi:ABC-type branched-subunit amino acid transport system substrate-binding protein